MLSGKFRLTLIDYNQNSVFNDYRGCCINIGSDGIIISGYNEKITRIFNNSKNFIFQNYPISINGNTFTLNNIRKNKQGVYVANLVKEKIDLDLVFKTRNKVLIDSIPDIKLLNLFTNKEVSIKNFKKFQRKLRINIMSREEFLIYLINGQNKLALKKYFTNCDFVNIVVVKNNTELREMKKYLKQKSNFLLIDTINKKQLALLGYNLYTKSTYLFDEKGKLILSDIYDNE